MSTQEETMRIVAEVVDKFSRPLRDLRTNLRGVDATPGNKRLRDQFRGLKDDSKALADGIGDQLAPAFGALNIRTLTVGGAISAVAIGLRGLSSDVYALSMVSKETGLTIDRMRGLEAAGERVGISGDRMRASFGSFARNMKELRAGVGGTLTDLFKNGDANVRNFALSLRSVGSNEEALNRVLKFLDRITNPIDKQRFLEAFGLPAELGRATSGQIEEYARRVGKSTGQLVRDAKALESAWLDVKDGWNELLVGIADTGALKAVGDILKGVADATEKTAKTIDLLRQHKYSEAFENEFGLTGRGNPKTNIKDLVASKQQELKRLDEILGDDKVKGANRYAVQKQRDSVQGEIFNLQRQLKEGTQEGAKKGASEGIQEGLKKTMLERPAGGAGGGPLLQNAAYTPSRGGGVMRERLRRFSAPLMIPGGGEGGGTPAPGDYSGGTGGLKGNAASWMEFMMRSRDEGGLGLSREQAAGGVGNLQAESGKGIPSWGPTGDGGTAWGTAQWRGDRLRRLMRMFPDSYKTVEAQQKFMRWEMDHTESRAYRALRGARTPEEAAAAFDRHYERSSGGARLARERNARRLFDAARNNPVAGGGKVEGDARVKIDLNGFPRGTKTQAEASGFFSQVELNRGRTMPIADESN